MKKYGKFDENGILIAVLTFNDPNSTPDEEGYEELPLDRDYYPLHFQKVGDKIVKRSQKKINKSVDDLFTYTE